MGLRARAWAFCATVVVAGGMALGPATGAHASFPGANGLIVWSHATSLTTPYQLYVMPPDGGTIHQLTHSTGNVSFPAWSADGRSIAYEEAIGNHIDVIVANADGSNEHDITNDSAHADVDPAWSPDGNFIVFSRQTAFTTHGPLIVVNADGSDPHAITSGSATNRQPTWSPDGQWIVFSSDRDGNLELYAIHPDGTGLRRLTKTPTRHEENPNWSPDGRSIAFDACVASSFPCPGSANYEIYVGSVSGTVFSVRQITDVAGIDANPAFSPDGTQIVFRSDRTGTTQLWKMAADGSVAKQLTFANFNGGVDPDWRPQPA